MTILVTWQLIVTLDSIRNSCDVLGIVHPTIFQRRGLGTLTRYCMALQDTVWYFYNIVLHILYCIIMYCMIWYCFICIIHGIVWYCMVFYAIVLCCLVLCDIVYHTIQCNKTQHNTIACDAVQYITIQNNLHKQNNINNKNNMQYT